MCCACLVSGEVSCYPYLSRKGRDIDRCVLFRQRWSIMLPVLISWGWDVCTCLVKGEVFRSSHFAVALRKRAKISCYCCRKSDLQFVSSKPKSWSGVSYEWHIISYFNIYVKFCLVDPRQSSSLVSLCTKTFVQRAWWNEAPLVLVFKWPVPKWPPQRVRSSGTHWAQNWFTVLCIVNTIGPPPPQSHWRSTFL
jgi:hypothetical protein